MIRLVVLVVLSCERKWDLVVELLDVFFFFFFLEVMLVGLVLVMFLT